ncbi:hypothetical protein C2857_001429 [Epichloe festucae Fl1]|uniref:Uncharacterized protein n=1 Tax=Epichloe festucae (strain Fl1) TaxID=877507 RepID=A0A7S9KN91_EPIFF|nr:hypothetical protein C2857_001429 [Epichloe festucae Fl1]
MHPSRTAKSPISDVLPLSSQPSSPKVAPQGPPAQTRDNAKLDSRDSPQPEQVKVQSNATSNVNTDISIIASVNTPASIPTVKTNVTAGANTNTTNTDANADTSIDTSIDTDINASNPQLATAVAISASSSAATSTSTFALGSNQSSDASVEILPMDDFRKSCITFPDELPKPGHSPSIPTPVDAPSESSFGRKSSVSSVSFRRSRNPSIDPSLHKPMSNGPHIRAASPPPQR